MSSPRNTFPRTPFVLSLRRLLHHEDGVEAFTAIDLPPIQGHECLSLLPETYGDNDLDRFRVLLTEAIDDLDGNPLPAQSLKVFFGLEEAVPDATALTRKAQALKLAPGLGEDAYLKCRRDPSTEQWKKSRLQRALDRIERHFDERAKQLRTTADANDPATILELNNPSAADLEKMKRLAESHFGTSLEISRLAETLLDSHPTVEHFSMEVKLRDRSKTHYTFFVERRFQSRFDHYVIGFALGDDAKAALMRQTPELKDIIWLPETTDDIDSLIAEFIESGLLERKNRKQKTGYESVSFEPFGLEGLNLDVDPSVQLRLIRGKLESVPELREYRSVLAMPMERSRRRCGWSADGMTYVDRIAIDLESFADAKRSNNANAYFFMPGEEAESTANDPLKFERVVGDWIHRHHGFAIQW